MKRQSFLRLALSASSLLTIPITHYANNLKNRLKNRLDKGFNVGAGKDRFDKPITLFEGDTFYTKVSTKDTDGDMYVFESTRIKKGGPALHYHFDQDEWWYVLEGEFLIKVGDKTYEVKAGDSVFGPRGVPHAFAKTNEENARLLMIFQPAGKMEELFQAISEGKLAKMSEEEKTAFRKAHGLVQVGPALTYLKK